MRTTKLTTWILLGMLLGIGAGYATHELAPDAAAAKNIAGYFSMITDIFLRLIKMIVAPIVFATLVSGIAGMRESSAIGRIGFRAIGWFVAASVISLTLGLLLSNFLQLGHAMNLPLPDAAATTKLNTASLNLKDFLTHIFPKSIFDAMAQNEVLQIVIFSLFFGFALGSLKDESADQVIGFIQGLSKAMLRVTDYVMRFAPIGVFAAVASVIATQGFGVLFTYGKFLGGFYMGLALLWAILIGVGYFFLRSSVFTLLKLLRAPIMLAFSTASSESAFPKTLEQLEKFGVDEKVSGFVLPLGYSFNLDGSMMYQAFAILFIAQAYNIDMSLSQQLTMLLVLMISSKGMAGVSRASLVVVAAVLPMFNLPEAGLLLIMGIDQFLDMGRTATNVVGNGIAASVIAKWEGALGKSKPVQIVAPVNRVAV
jgi:Na+/H+-dicarboxylate symporter